MTAEEHMPEIIKRHLGWIAGYCECATDDNWRDILNRIEDQIRLAKRDAALTPAK